MNCYVYGCKSNWNPYDDISFFKFPLKDENLLKKWFEVIPFNKNRKITKNSRICSNHFDESQYIYKGNRRVLIDGAIPIFPYVDNEKNIEDENLTPECDVLENIKKDISKDNNDLHQCSIQEQETSSRYALLLSMSTTREKIQATPQVDKAIQVFSETQDIAIQSLPNPSKIEEKLQQQINALKQRLHQKEVKLSKIYQQLKRLRTEGKTQDQEKG